jgi:plasmid maintenance system antidote protein VapI
MNNIPKIRIEEAIDIYQKKTGKKMNQRKLSNIIKNKRSVNTVINYINLAINGKKELPITVLMEISKVLGVSVDFLVGLKKR